MYNTIHSNIQKLEYNTL